jgi:hypothetical protein
MRCGPLLRVEDLEERTGSGGKTPESRRLEGRQEPGFTSCSGAAEPCGDSGDCRLRLRFGRNACHPLGSRISFPAPQSSRMLLRLQPEKDRRNSCLSSGLRSKPTGSCRGQRSMGRPRPPRKLTRPETAVDREALSEVKFPRFIE